MRQTQRKIPERAGAEEGMYWASFSGHRLKKSVTVICLDGELLKEQVQDCGRTLRADRLFVGPSF